MVDVVLASMPRLPMTPISPVSPVGPGGPIHQEPTSLRNTVLSNSFLLLSTPSY